MFLNVLKLISDPARSVRWGYDRRLNNAIDGLKYGFLSWRRFWSWNLKTMYLSVPIH